MREILFLAHRIPFPPDRGDKIRSHHVLRRLARLAPVHVGCFGDDDLDMTEEAELGSVASSYCLLRRSRPLPVAGIEALVRRCPVSLTAFRDRAMADYVAKVLASRSISAIYVYSGQMGQYVPEDYRGRVVADFVDVDSAKFEAYASGQGAVMRRIYQREARLLRAEEARMAARAGVSLLVSEAERDLFVSRLPAHMAPSADVRAMANGIDSVGFDPSTVAPETRMLDCGGPRIVFTGQMDYRPNVEAALRVIERILPRLRETHAGASFHVVGRNPVPQLLDRDGLHGVHVWGRVDDIRPWLKAADLALVPLEIARGIQNKVLEAMAMELPVVMTQAAATGIGGTDGHHYRIADSDDEIVERVLELMRDLRRARVKGLAARRYVIASRSWLSVLAGLPEVVGWAGRAVPNAA